MWSGTTIRDVTGWAWFNSIGIIEIHFALFVKQIFLNPFGNLSQSTKDFDCIVGPRNGVVVFALCSCSFQEFVAFPSAAQGVWRFSNNVVEHINKCFFGYDFVLPEKLPKVDTFLSFWWTWFSWEKTSWIPQSFGWWVGSSICWSKGCWRGSLRTNWSNLSPGHCNWWFSKAKNKTPFVWVRNYSYLPRYFSWQNFLFMEVLRG